MLQYHAEYTFVFPSTRDNHQGNKPKPHRIKSQIYILNIIYPFYYYYYSNTILCDCSLPLGLLYLL